MNLRNVAIIAHVDHGKTTLVDGLLKQSKTFRENEAAFSQTLIMDSNDQERERGITILSKNTAVKYGETKINIIDTPGHADFGGEVERILNMADGAILVVDAQEGPMPQTKFVLKKALEIGLKPIVVINKIDKPNSRIDEVISKTSDLFLDLATNTDQLDFPVYYAVGRDGKAWNEMPENSDEIADLTPVFDAILNHVPAPDVAHDEPFQMLVTSLDRDSFQGKHVIGRIKRGFIKPGTTITLIKKDGTTEQSRIDKVYVSQGLKKIEIEEANAGEIVSLTGVRNASIGDTIADSQNPEALPTIEIEEPTLKMSVGANTSPFAGKEGQFVTSRQILERINKELETNVSLKMEMGGEGNYILSGRGELHLSVFIENLRREGFELQVGKPQVITKIVSGKENEPIEELTIDVATEHVGAVTSEVGRRKGNLLAQEENADSTTRLMFEISTRGLLGLRNQLLTLSRGTAIMNSLFLRFQPVGAPIPRLRNGALIASEPGKAVAYGLNNAQARGTVFINPQTQVYEGMIVGLNAREGDLEINVTKEKKLTNVRASSSDEAIALTPPTVLSLEQSLDFLEDDELLEVTPKYLRLRKRLLNATARSRARK
ncbi:TPA: translational GTPase TypA [candidate division CPR2 bacterium]|uniref:Large ribosomal subunit assembly factor BipA n=1 Tax=candidate division CPR2 bacterium GW2011_GWC1_41_48 TaxID=1618344 RepID=A0A0G0WCM4_UNCC2|nr:MAG: Small GTP-binding protein [candidate division CPR2 bacterium GW2011_GWC2_39_35]KKR28095.1 MAG: Small GTP-binding protein [candidate division CPR2 bacterium GW2011_GWD1_39_7]KKS09807.1 MAG: Small GTP-binding protein [candidate division CPR2 bacterium GW2011_GWC1_41_48]OGB60293.1 MAG: GTP-binding protein TypA [candidate division CPR2 bacterium GWD1_39_7]HBG81602.1 translational GTPase TypA [candidate division CPR2 bacterium]